MAFRLDARRALHGLFLAGAIGGLFILLGLARGTKASAWDFALSGYVLAMLGTHVYLLAGGRGSWRVARAMMARGWQTLLSYRFQLVMLLLQMLLFAVLVVTLGQPIVNLVFGPVGSALGAYTSTNYVVFLMLGFSLMPVLWSAYQVTSQRLRQEQMTGMFESLIVTPAGARTLPFAYLLGSVVNSLFSFVGVLVVFRLLLPAEGSLAVTDPLAVSAFLAILAPAVVTMWGIGLLMGGLTAVFKQAQQATSTMRVLMIAFGGIYIPLALMPAWANVVARALPVSYAGEGVRGALAEGSFLYEMGARLLILVAFALVASILGMWSYRRLLDRARRSGTLYGY